MNVVNLFGIDIDIQSKNKDIVKKINNPKKVRTSTTTNTRFKNMSISDKLTIINNKVDKTLGIFKDKSCVITSKEELTNYMVQARRNGVVAIDTETNNSLDPFTCQLMGVCLYTPGLSSAYVPVNHVDLSDNRLDWQVTEQDIKQALETLYDNTSFLTHNGKFDYEVIYCTCDTKVPIYWDSMIAAKVLDENEYSAGLKQQYIDKIDKSIEKYSIDELFNAIEYKYVDPEVFALYAATDAYMTYKLYEYQRHQFEQSDNNNIYKLFLEIEMPIVTVAAEMELTGICIDEEYSKRLSKKYHEQYEDLQQKIDDELDRYSEAIEQWRQTDEANFHPTKSTGNGVGKSKSEQLEEPINVSSPTQLAILLYDILKVPSMSKKSPRGTGEDILKKINLPICDMILQQRGLSKLINTYIDKLPECVSPRDNRLHAHFNQYGAATGRFSSSDPNLQNIPSHNNEIRMMFVPSAGNVFVGSDYSAQEVRLLACYCNDDNMYEVYKNDKDLYASVASLVYKNNYEDNKEFWPDGSPNPEGKKRRSNCKSIVLGLMYGRGISSIAEQIKSHEGNTTREDIKEAQNITDTFFNNFPNVKKWIDETQAFAHKYNYVEDLWGRRRRLPDLSLPKFVVEDTNNHELFNPLFDTYGINNSYSEDAITNYVNKLNSCRTKYDVDTCKKDLISKGFKVKDNSGFIAQAERQCVNARIQGGAASLSKKAMIEISRDEVIRNLGFKLLIAVHDELIGECPIENAEKVADRLSYIMVEAAKPECVIPMKCDTTIEECWYLTDYKDALNKKFHDLVLKYNSEERAFNDIKDIHCELPEYKLREYIQC